MAKEKNGTKQPVAVVPPTPPVVDDAKKDDVPPTPPPPPTQDEILAGLVEAAKKAANDYATASTKEDVDDSELDKLSMASFKARDAVKQLKNKIAAEKAQAELDAKESDYMLVVTKFHDAIIAEFKLLSSMPIADKRSDVQKAQLQAAYDTKKGFEADILTERKKSFKVSNPTVIHIPAGMTGKQLTKVTTGETAEKTGKLEIYKGLIRGGMTKEQIMAQYPDSIDANGGANGTLRTAITAVNKENTAKA